MNGPGGTSRHLAKNAPAGAGPNNPAASSAAAARARRRFAQRIFAPKSSTRLLTPPTFFGPGVADPNLLRAFRKPAALVVAFPRSGRTWLRVMLALAFEREFDAFSANPLDSDGWARAEPRLPRVVVTAGRREPRVLPPEDVAPTLSWPGRHSFVLLARDPRDVIVSIWHERTSRAAHERRLPRFDGSLSDLLRADRGGLRTVVAYLNHWAVHKHAAERFLLVKYEHLLDDTALEFGRVLSFIGLAPSRELIDELVRQTTFEYLRRMEVSGRLGYKPNADLLADPAALALRRGAAGGYRDHFTQDDHRYAERILGALDPMFGYCTR